MKKIALLGVGAVVLAAAREKYGVSEHVLGDES